MDYNLRQIATSNSFHRNPNSHALPKSAKVFQTGFTRHQHGFKEKRAEANICAQFIPEPPSTGSLSLDCTRFEASENAAREGHEIPTFNLFNVFEILDHAPANGSTPSDFGGAIRPAASDRIALVNRLRH